MNHVTEQQIDPEKAVLDYLYEHGNTRENDLLNIIKIECGYSLGGSKKVLARLENKKKIFRVVHAKLRPPNCLFQPETTQAHRTSKSDNPGKDPGKGSGG